MRAEPSDPARLEAFLARLYVDSDARAEFLSDRGRAADAAGLDEAQRSAVVALDAGALELAARSFTHKRQHARALRPQSKRLPWFRRVLAWLYGA